MNKKDLKKSVAGLGSAFIIGLGIAGVSYFALQDVAKDVAKYNTIKDNMVKYYTSSAEYKYDISTQSTEYTTMVLTDRMSPEDYNAKMAELTSRETAVKMMKESDYVDLAVDYNNAEQGLEDVEPKRNAGLVGIVSGALLAIASGGMLASMGLQKLGEKVEDLIIDKLIDTPKKPKNNKESNSEKVNIYEFGIDGKGIGDIYNDAVAKTTDSAKMPTYANIDDDVAEYLASDEENIKLTGTATGYTLGSSRVESDMADPDRDELSL